MSEPLVRKKTALAAEAAEAAEGGRRYRRRRKSKAKIQRKRWKRKASTKRHAKKMKARKKDRQAKGTRRYFSLEWLLADAVDALLEAATDFDVEDDANDALAAMDWKGQAAWRAVMNGKPGAEADLLGHVQTAMKKLRYSAAQKKAVKAWVDDLLRRID